MKQKIDAIVIFVILLVFAGCTTTHIATNREKLVKNQEGIMIGSFGSNVLLSGNVKYEIYKINEPSLDLTNTGIKILPTNPFEAQAVVEGKYNIKKTVIAKSAVLEAGKYILLPTYNEGNSVVAIPNGPFLYVSGSGKHILGTFYFEVHSGRINYLGSIVRNKGKYELDNTAFEISEKEYRDVGHILKSNGHLETIPVEKYIMRPVEMVYNLPKDD